MTLTEARRLHQITGRPAWTWTPLGRLAVTDTAAGVAWSDWDPKGGPTSSSITVAQLLRRRASIVRRAVTR
jgi:hypothetical protein